MIIERLFPSGAYRITDIVNGQFISRVYMDYTRREAIALFRQYRRELKKPKKHATK